MCMTVRLLSVFFSSSPPSVRSALHCNAMDSCFVEGLRAGRWAGAAPGFQKAWRDSILMELLELSLEYYDGQ